MKSILFVCTGNTCRSPMAEAFLRTLIKADPFLGKNFTSVSAGISAYEDDNATREAISVMRSDWGIDISSHRASAFTAEHITDSHLILVMTESHKNHIIAFYPEAAEKTFTLIEYAHGRKSDIQDPWGKSLSSYSQCASEIRQAVVMLAENLKKSQ